ATKVVDRALLEPATARLGEVELRDQALRGGYRLVDHRDRPGYEPGANVVNLAATGVMVPEAIAASRLLDAEGIFANVLALTSPQLCYDGWRGWLDGHVRKPGGRPPAWLRRLGPRRGGEGPVPHL